jgi:triacylglycerol lipase
MSVFNPRFAHDTLLPIAEAAYVSSLQPGELPANYTVLGPITLDQAAVAAAPPKHQVVMQKMMAVENFFGWVLQNTTEKTAVVAFRGTQDLEDWLHNLDFLLTPYQPVANYGTVHQGFQSYYMAMRQSIFTLLQKADTSTQRLISTGHSLGAGLSELAAPDLLHNAKVSANGFTLPPEVQNFAGPRVGHHDFSSLFDVQIDVCFRVVNIWDIVPTVPPPLIFEHVGLAVKIDGGFTLDELVAHSMEKSYGPGLLKLIPQAAAVPHATSVPAASVNFPNTMMIGREP